jgi:hypothetical protein
VSDALLERRQLQALMLLELVDTVYAHVFAWQRAFAEAGIDLQ